MSVRHQEVATLRRETEQPCVSVFLGVEQTAPGGAEDRLRLERLIAAAEAELREGGTRLPVVDEMLRPLRAMASRGPWRETGRSVALYSAPGGIFHRFHLQAPLADQSFVATRFILWPLLREVGRQDRYALLAVSRKEVRLFGGDVGGLRRLRATSRLPDFASLVADDETPVATRHLQRTGGGPAAATGSRQRHGGLRGDRSARVNQWLHILAKAVDAELRDVAAPLVLAGVGEELAVLRARLKHPAIVASDLTGNPDRLADKQLHERALPLVRRWYDEGCSADVALFEQRADTAWVAVGSQDVLAAASEDRVGVLFLSAQADAGAQAALDPVACDVWASGGRVHVVDEAPGGAQVAAVMRFATVPPLDADQDRTTGR